VKPEPPKTFCFAYGTGGKVQYGKLAGDTKDYHEPHRVTAHVDRNAYFNVDEARGHIQSLEDQRAAASGEPPRKVFVWPFDASTDVFAESAIARTEKLRRKTH
jgi:hypothetical protein